MKEASVGHGQNLGFKSRYNGKRLENFKQGKKCDPSLRRPLWQLSGKERGLRRAGFEAGRPARKLLP